MAIAPRTGPGRPAAYCADPDHNAVRAHRATKRFAAAAELPVEPGDLAAELARARQLVTEAERKRHGAEREAHAARRERDAALALRDLAVEDAAEVRDEAAETVSRMRREFDREVAAVAAVADAEIARVRTAHTLGDHRPRRTA